MMLKNDTVDETVATKPLRAVKSNFVWSARKVSEMAIAAVAPTANTTSIADNIAAIMPSKSDIDIVNNPIKMKFSGNLRRAFLQQYNTT